MEENINLDEELEKIANSIDKAIDEAFKNEKNINFINAGIDFASKKDEQNLNVQTDNFDMNIKNNEITINAKEKENHTLRDLRQKLINDLYNQKYYSKDEIEILKILFENNDIKKD